MVRLRIEHPISDFAMWKGALDRFAPKREAAGVLAHRIFTASDGGTLLTLDLDFLDEQSAERFRAFPQNEVRSSQGAAPALAGTPLTRLLTPMD